MSPDRPGFAARVLLGLLWFYRNAISPWMAPRCRYYPSCSTYAVQAVQTHGAVRGSWLAVKRLLRCNPWSLGGVDDVPPRPALVAEGERWTC